MLPILFIFHILPGFCAFLPLPSLLWGKFRIFLRLPMSLGSHVSLWSLEFFWDFSAGHLPSHQSGCLPSVSMHFWRTTVPIRGEDISPPFYKHRSKISQSYLFFDTESSLGKQMVDCVHSAPYWRFPASDGVCTAWLTRALAFWGGRSLESDHCLNPL